jgi:putative FmdB family regulatory protein
VPIYEFYCPDCHTIFNFYSVRIETDKRPDCPRCGKLKLERRMSVFSHLKGAEEDDLPPEVDEGALTRAVSSLAANEKALESDDPRLAAKAMRDFYRAGGLKMGAGAEEYLRRLEAGQDPEEVDQELGDILDQEDPLLPSRSRAGAKTSSAGEGPPAKDETLYEL